MKLRLRILACLLWLAATPCSLVFAQFQQVTLGGSPLNPAGWTLRGMAQAPFDTPADAIPNNEVLLCPAQTNRSGSIFYNTPLDISQCNQWNVEFDFYINGGTGADGIAFCFLANPPTGAVGGGGIGLPPNPLGIMVVFDQWNNCGGGNPELQLRYGTGTGPYSECPVPAQPTALNQAYVRDTKYNRCRVEFDNSTGTGAIRVLINTGSGFNLILTGNYVPTFSLAYFGFTASTGAGTDIHAIRDVVINIPGAPAANAGPDRTYCTGNSATLGSGAPVGGVNYSWNPATGLTSPNSLTTTVNLTNPGTTPIVQQYVLTASSASGSCANRDTVLVTVNPQTTAPTVRDTIICNATVASIFASGSPGALNYQLFDAPTGGNLIVTGNPLNVAPASTTTYYVGAITPTGCPGPRSPVTVTVQNAPAAPTVVSPLNICSNSSANIIPTGPAGVLFNFYSAITGGTPLASNVSQWQTPVLSGNTNYYVESVTSGGCLSASRTLVQVIVGGGSAPQQPRISSPASLPINVCAGNASPTITATCQTGPCPNNITYDWFTDSIGGTPVFTTTATASTFSPGILPATTTYWVQATQAGCANNTRTPVTVNVVPIPVAPTVPAVTVCASSTPVFGAEIVITAPLPVPANLRYRAYPTAVSMVPTASSAFGSNVIVLATTGITTSATFFIEAETQNGCRSATRTAVTVTINPPPDDPVLAATVVNPVLYTLQVCNGNSATTSVTAPNTAGLVFYWYNAAGDITPIDTTLVNEPFVSPPLTANRSYFVETVSGPQCRSDNRVELRITVIAAVPAPVVSPVNRTICAGGSTTITPTPVASTTFSYYTTPTGGTPIASGASFTLNNITRDSIIYVEASRTAQCTSTVRTAVNITVSPTPPEPNVAGLFSVCSGDNIVLVASVFVPNVDFRWYDAATGGTLLTSGSVFTQNNFTSNRTIYLEAFFTTAPNCARVPRTQINLVANALPATPTIADVSICSASASVDLTPSAPAGVNFEWFDVNDAAATPIFFGGTYTTPTLSANTTYYVRSISTAPCPSALVPVSVLFNPPPTTPTMTSATICAGQNATLSVSSPQGGVTYRWYTQAVGGASVFSGTSRTLNGLTADTTFFVEAFALPNCTSGRTAVSATVSAAPAAPSVSGTTAICSGANVSLTASTTGSNLNYRWFDAATGGNLLQTGATLSLTNVTSNRSVFVETFQTVSPNCVSVSRTQVDIVVTPLPAAPTVTGSLTVCQGSAINITANTPGSNLNYRWFDAATGGNLLQTGSAFSVASLNANQTVFVETFITVAPGCVSSTRTQVNLVAVALPAVPTASDQSVCIGSPVSVTASAAGSNIDFRWFDAATGGNLLQTGATFSLAALNANQTVFVETFQTVAPGCVSSSRRQVNLTAVALPAVPTASDQSVCLGSPVSVTASAAGSNINFRWFDAATGGNLLQTGATFSLAALNANQTVFVETFQTVAPGCVSSSRRQVNLTAVALPAVPTASDVSVCLGSPVSVTASAAGSNINFRWFDAATGGNLLQTGATFSLAALNANQTVFVETFQTVAPGCVSSSRRQVNLTAVALPAVPTASDQSVCVGSPVSVTASAAGSNIDFRWFDAATGGNLLQTGATFSLAALNANQTVFVETFQTVAPGCVSSSRRQVNLTAVALPAVPTASDVSVCLGSPVSVTASATGSNINFRWFDAATGGNLLQTGATFSLAALNANQTVFVETFQTVAPGCVSSSRRQVNLTAVALPVVPTASDVSVCLGSPVSVTASATGSNINFRWFDAATGGNLLQTGATFSLAALNANQTVFVETFQTVAPGCVSSSRRQVNLTVIALPAITTQPLAQTVCPGEPATFTVAASGDGLTYQWQLSTDGGATFGNITNGGVYSNATTPTLNISDATGLNNNRYRVVVSGTCPPTQTSNAVTLVVRSLPSITLEPVDVVACAGSPATFSATASGTGVSFQWQISTDGGATFTNLSNGGVYSNTGTNNLNISNVTGLDGNRYRVIATGTCAPAATSVSALLTVNTAPVITGPPVTVIVCTGNMAGFLVTATGTGLTYQWQISTDGGTTFSNLSNGGVYTGATLPSLSISNTTGLNGNFYRVIVSGACAPAQTSTAAQLIVNQVPNITLDPTNQSICAGSSATFSTTHTGTGVSLQWQQSTDGGATFANISNGGVFSGATSNDLIISDVTGLGGNRYRLIATGACPPNDTSAVAILTVNTLPVIDQQPFSTSVCAGAIAALTVTASGTGLSYQWQLSTDGGATFSNVPSAAPYSGVTSTALVINDVTGLNGNQYRVIVSGTCPPSQTSNAVTLTVTDRPVVTVSPSSLTVCVGEAVNLTASSTSSNVTFNWFDAATGGNLLQTGATFSLASLNANQSVFVSATPTANATCVGTRTQVDLVAVSQPAAPAVSGTTTVCAGEPISLTANTIGANIDYRWFDAATGGTLLQSGSTFTLAALSANQTVFVESFITLPPGCISSTRTQVDLVANAIPAVPVVGDTGTCVAGSTITLAPSGPAAVTFEWFADNLPASLPISSGPTFTTAPIAGNTSIFVGSRSAQGCVSARVQVNISLNATPADPALASQTACVGSNVNLTITAPVSGEVYRWYAASSGGASLHTGSALTLSNIQRDTFFFVEAFVPPNCLSPGRTRVDVTVNPLPTVALGGGGNFCANQTPALAITLTGTPPFTVSYDSAGVPRTRIYNTAGSQPFGPSNLPLGSTTFTVTGLTDANSCNGVVGASLVVVRNANPAPVLTGPLLINLPAGDTTVRVSNPVAGHTYAFQVSPPAVAQVVSANADSVVIQPLAAGTAQVIVIQTDPATGCTGRDTLLITVQNSCVSPDLIAPVAVCADEPFVTVRNQTWDPAFNYAWVLSGNGAILVNNDDSLRFRPVGAGQVRVIVRTVDPAGICLLSDTIFVDITALPDSNLAILGDTACVGSTAAVIVQGIGPGVSYTLLDGTTGQPVAVTQTPLGASIQFNVPITAVGPQTYRVLATSGPGCAVLLLQTVTVVGEAFPAAPTPTQAAVTSCSGSQVTLSVTTSTGVSHRWYDAPTLGNLLQTADTLRLSPSANQTVYVSAVSAFGCESSRVPVVMNVIGNIPAPNALDTTACFNQSITVIYAPDPAGYVYNWYADGTTTVPALTTNGSLVTPNLRADTVIFVSRSLGPCESPRVPVTITVTPNTFTPRTDTLQACVNDTASFMLPRGAAFSYLWYTDTTAQPFSGNAEHTFTVSDTGTVYIRVFINGCYLGIRTLFLEPQALPDTGLVAAPNPTLVDSTVSLLAPGQTGVSYEWLVDGVPLGTGTQQSISFPNAGQYRVSLLATNTFGCQSVTERIVTVNLPDDLPFVPNVFTPNGDGVNDRLLVTKLFFPKSFSMTVFDRWGQQVAAWTNFQDGWDGTFNDSPAPDGVYFYQLKVILSDDRVHERAGSVTLIR